MGSRFFTSVTRCRFIAPVVFLLCLGLVGAFNASPAFAQDATITDVRTSPNSGSIRSATEGSQVYIIGTNFTGATAVDFNGTAATFTPLNATQILAIVPAGATLGPIHVVTPVNTATSPFFFDVVAPAPTNTPVPAPTATAAPNPGKIKITLPAKPTIVEEDTSASNVFTVELECATSNSANVPPQSSVTVELEATSPGFSPTLSPSRIVFPSGACPASVPVSMTFTGDDAIQGDQDITITATSTSADPAYNGLTAPTATILRNDQHDAYATFIDIPRTSETDQRTGRVSNFKIALRYVGLPLLDEHDRLIAAGDLEPRDNVFVTVSVTDAPGHPGGADEAKIYTDTQRIANTSQILIFTPSNYRTEQNIYVQGLDDTDTDGDRLFNVSVTKFTSSDPEYNNLPLDPPAGNLVVNVDDEADDNQANELPGVIIAPASSPTAPVTTNESGSTAVFLVRLNSKPTANVIVNLRNSRTDEGTVVPTSLTFTPLNWDQSQQVTVTGVDDAVQDGDQLYRIVTTVVSNDINYGGNPSLTPATPPIDPLDVFVLNQDNEAAGFTVNPGVLIIDEGAQQSFSVRLNRQPSNDVVINLRSANPTIVSADKPRLTFTSTNWSTPQTVIVRSFDNFTRNLDQSFTITLDPAISADAQYNGNDPVDVTGIVLDDEVADITVSRTTGLQTTEAGGTDTFTVRLTSQPTADVTFDLSSSDLTEGTVSPTTLTFTAADWATPQTVTVTGVDDAELDGNVAYRIVSSSVTSTDTFYSGMKMLDVVVVNADNEVAFIVTPVSLTTIEGGPLVTFTIKLNSQPTANVVINLVSSDTTEGTVAPTGLTFTPTNFATAQTVRVTPQEDSLRDGSVSYRITGTVTSSDTGFSNSPFPVVTVVNQDNDNPGVIVSPLTIAVTEGGPSASFIVKLISRPAANVTLGLSTRAVYTGPAGEIALDRTSLTFTPDNYATEQTVQVTAVDDFVKELQTYYYVITAPLSSSDPNYNGLDPKDVTVQLNDNDNLGVLISPASGLRTTEAGGNANFTVRLTSRPRSNVTLALTSSDTTEGILNKSTLVFTPNTGQAVSGTTSGWNVLQTVTLRGVNDTLEDGDVNYVVRVAVSSSDTFYNNFFVPRITAVNADDGDDNTRPQITILTPAANSVQRVLLNATGTASDNKAVAKVTARIYRFGTGVYVAADGSVSPTYNPAIHELPATGTTSWKVRLPALSTGRYLLWATATDTAGRTNTVGVQFFIDQAGPVITLQEPIAGKSYTSISQATGKIVDVGGGTAASASAVLYQFANASTGRTAGYYNGTSFQSTGASVPISLAADGTFTLSFPPLTPGRFYIQVRASDNFGNNSSITPVGFSIVAPTPTPTPVATPIPGATPTPVPGQPTFTTDRGFQLISVPYMDGTDRTATTTVDRAFSVPRTAPNGAVNFRLYEFDPITETYINNPEGLLGNSVLRRGVGYFIQPVSGSVSLKIPAVDATRKPLTDSTFDIVLRRNESNDLSNPNNGFNLIGFPFDPARFTLAQWNTATVIAPDGRTFASPAEAQAGGVMFPDLYEYNPTTGSYEPVTELKPYRGYSARTKVNGVIVRLTAQP